VQRKLGALRRRHSTSKPRVPASFCAGNRPAIILSRSYETVLVIGAEKLSSIVNWKDRNTASFLATARARRFCNIAKFHGLLTAVMGADGNRRPALDARWWQRVSGHAGIRRERLHYLRMDGKETFKNAVNAMVSRAHEAMRRCDVDIPNKCVIPIRPTSASLMRSANGSNTPEQLFVNLHKYGNSPPRPWRLRWTKPWPLEKFLAVI